jgi:hypothetical protein
VSSFITPPNTVVPSLAVGAGFRLRTARHTRLIGSGCESRSASAGRELVQLNTGRREIAAAGGEAVERVPPRKLKRTNCRARERPLNRTGKRARNLNDSKCSIMEQIAKPGFDQSRKDDGQNEADNKCPDAGARNLSQRSTSQSRRNEGQNLDDSKYPDGGDF